MKLIKRFLPEISLSFVILAAYFATRLTKLTTLPLFTDEAIYTRWSQIALLDPNWRLISLTDGKQPMFIWLDLIVMRFVHDPLLAGRLVSVGAGLLTVVGLFFLARELFKNTWIGIVSSLLYVIYPFALVYDRMALYDSLVAAFAVWGLYIEVLLVRKVRLDLAFITALVVGGGILTKTNAFFNIYFLPATLLLFDFKQTHWVRNLWRWILYAVVATILAYLYYSVLRLSPFFGIIAEKDHTFIYPVNEWLHHPFTFFMGNLSGLWDWFLQYTTWIGFGLLASTFFVEKKFWREKILLLFWSVAPFIALALFAKVLYPRYIFPMTVTILPLLALTLVSLSKLVRQKVFLVVLFLILGALWFWKDYYIIFDFAHAPIPLSDLTQYINGWPAGGGIREMVSYFDNQAKGKKIYVLSQGTFGSIPTLGVEIYLDNNKNIEKRGLWPIPNKMPADLLEKAKTMPVYVVFDQTDVPPAWNANVVLVKQYQKGISTDYLRIYRVLPQQ